MTTTPQNLNTMLRTLLKMHEEGQELERTFIESNAEIFERLWAKGYGCYRITRMQAGNIRPRREYAGLLTPRGIEAARALGS